jgi:hypothetical protein
VCKIGRGKTMRGLSLRRYRLINAYIEVYENDDDDDDDDDEVESVAMTNIQVVLYEEVRKLDLNTLSFCLFRRGGLKIEKYFRGGVLMHIFKYCNEL